MIATLARTMRAALVRTYARARGCLAGYDAYDVSAVAVFATLAVLAATTFDSYAISNDEEVQRRYGELIVSYYTSGFADQSLFHYRNLYLYGGLFDVVAVLFERALPMIDAYTIRHLLCAVTGIGGITAAWATARMVAGTRAGAIAAFTLAVCGPWYGAMFNHTKDIPFAAAMMGATYFLLRAARDLPRPRMRDVISFGLLLGAALGIRVLGLLLIGYAGLAISWLALQLRDAPTRERLNFFVRSGLALSPAFLIAYVIMIAAWPWAAQAPLNPLRGLLGFSQFNYEIKTLLAGQIYTMGDVPRWYIPAYMLVKLPLLVLSGAALALLFVLRPGRAVQAPGARGEIALLVFIAVFPVICEVIDRGPAFTGLRHFLFVVPPIAVLAGIGFDRLLTQAAARQRWLMHGAAVMIVGLIAWNAFQLVRLHPYQYLYYNQLVGGLQGASGRYETDYWVNIMPEAVNDLEAFVAALDRRTGNVSHRYTVAVCGERVPFEKQANARLQWTDDWRKAEFFIAPTHMNCDRVLVGTEISTIARDGTIIGVVKDRRMLVQPTIANQR